MTLPFAWLLHSMSVVRKDETERVQPSAPFSRVTSLTELGPGAPPCQALGHRPEHAAVVLPSPVPGWLQHRHRAARAPRTSPYGGSGQQTPNPSPLEHSGNATRSAGRCQTATPGLRPTGSGSDLTDCAPCVCDSSVLPFWLLARVKQACFSLSLLRKLG